MKQKRWRMRKTILLCGLFLLLIARLSTAQEFPIKPINILVAFAPGSPMDISLRLIASKAAKFLGQPIVITNNGGGGGAVATGIVAKEKPDGYHLLASTTSQLIWIGLFREVPYKFEDFVPVMHYGAPQSGTVVKADAPWKTMKELVEYAKKNPDKITCSTPGTKGPGDIAMLYIAKEERIQWILIPYPGTAPAFTAFLGGHATAFSGPSTWIEQVKEGSIRLLATHGEKRMKTFPDVPTLRELGYDFVWDTVFVVSAPNGTPPSILKKLDNALHKASDDPEVIQLLVRMEIPISYRNFEDTKRYLEEVHKNLRKTVDDLKLVVEPKVSK